MGAIFIPGGPKWSTLIRFEKKQADKLLNKELSRQERKDKKEAWQDKKEAWLSPYKKRLDLDFFNYRGRLIRLASPSGNESTSPSVNESSSSMPTIRNLLKCLIPVENSGSKLRFEVPYEKSPIKSVKFTESSDIIEIDGDEMMIIESMRLYDKLNLEERLDLELKSLKLDKESNDSPSQSEL